MNRIRRHLAGHVPTMVAACAVTACGGVAATFLDLPQQPTAPAERPAAATVPEREPQELPLPAIERVDDPDSVLALLPRDKAGYVDWVSAVRSGLIRPRAGIDGQERGDGSGFGFDFYFKGANPLFDAFFPHSAHVEWLACNNCHPSLFPYRGSEITMARINAREDCGACHGAVAFPPDNCERCHRQMQLPEGRAEARFIGDVRLERTVVDTLDASQRGATVFREALFRHASHRIRYRCSACHPDPFEPRAGSLRTTMRAMGTGESCGRCHSDSGPAFGLFQCDRCHTPQDE